MPYSLVYKRLYESLNYRLRGFAGGRFADSCRPTSISILLTENCNAKCVHCDIWKNRAREVTPSLDQWKQFVTDLRQWLGPVQITFTGGEALMSPMTVDLVRHSSAAGLFTELLTHGYWEDQGKIERVARAKPWRVTVSLDGIGETHTLIRGRPRFWERTTVSLDTLERMRRETGYPTVIRLKTVIMQHNLDDVPKVASFARDRGLEVFYQPIEQNYNTAEDPNWFQTGSNWPRDIPKAVAVARELIALKRSGLPIANSSAQLEAIIPYFENPEAMRVTTQAHSAHETHVHCNALTSLQLQANGDVTTCVSTPPVGNIKDSPIRTIWESRPRFWREGCCMQSRCSTAEKQRRGLVTVA